MDTATANEVMDLIDTLINAPIVPIEREVPKIVEIKPIIVEPVKLPSIVNPLPVEVETPEQSIQPFQELAPKGGIHPIVNLFALSRMKNEESISESESDTDSDDFIESYDDRNMSLHNKVIQRTKPVEPNPPKIIKKRVIPVQKHISVDTEIDNIMGELSDLKDNLIKTNQKSIQKSIPKSIPKLKKQPQSHSNSESSENDNYLGDIKNITKELSKNMVKDAKENLVQTQQYLKENKYEIMVDFLNYMVLIIDFLNKMIYKGFILLQEKIMGKGNNFFTVLHQFYRMLFYQWHYNSNNLADGGNVSGSSTGALTLRNVTSVLQRRDLSSHCQQCRRRCREPVCHARSYILRSVHRQSAGQPDFAARADSLSKRRGRRHSAAFLSVAMELNLNWSRRRITSRHRSTSALTIENLTPATAGSYSVLVSNALGVTTSSNALLAIQPLTASGVTLSILYSFTGETDGAHPQRLDAGHQRRILRHNAGGRQRTRRVYSFPNVPGNRIHDGDVVE